MDGMVVSVSDIYYLFFSVLVAVHINPQVYGLRLMDKCKFKLNKGGREPMAPQPSPSWAGQAVI